MILLLLSSITTDWVWLLIFTRFLDHTQRRTTVGRTPLNEWSVRRRDLYLTTHNNHNRQTSMPPDVLRIFMRCYMTTSIYEIHLGWRKLRTVIRMTRRELTDKTLQSLWLVTLCATCSTYVYINPTVLFTQHVYVFHVNLRTNCDFFFLHFVYRASLYNLL